MGVRLSNLPAYLEKWLPGRYDLHPGWETRSRSSGDFADVMAVGVHHTATRTSVASDLRGMLVTSDAIPVGNGLVCRDGRFILTAVRASNTQGKGGPYLTSRGVIPLNSGNTRMFSIEAQNNGVGEVWNDLMLETYILVVCAVIDCANNTQSGAHLDAGDVISHFEWTTRKVDPSGPCRFLTSNDRYMRWDMNKFRGEVAARLALGPPGSPVNPTHPSAPTLESNMVSCINDNGGYWLYNQFERRALVYPGNDMALIALLWDLEDQGVKFAGHDSTTPRGIPVPFNLKDWQRAQFRASQVVA